MGRLSEGMIDSRHWWRSVSADTIRADLIAGLLGALLVLPQGVAFARLAGLPPEYGIYTALLPCVLAALFGSSLHVTSGPTNMISLALLAMLTPLVAAGQGEYLQLVLAASLLVGLMQLLIAVFRLGVLANFIAPAVLAGFTMGAACLIGWHAMLGIRDLAMSGSSAWWAEPLIALLSIGATLLVVRLRPGWPAMLIGLLGAYLAAALLEYGADVPLARLGLIEHIVPPWSNPLPRFDQLPALFGIALALTLIASAQSISIAKVVAERSGQELDANREIRGQGIANLLGPFVSSYLACGSMNRSMPNFESGARTPLAAVFSSLLLLALVGLAAPVLAGIPLAAIEALLLYVAWSLIDLRRLREIVRFSHADATCLFVTWFGLLLIRMEIALLIGMGLSLAFYLVQSSRPAMHSLVPWGPGRRFTPIAEIAADPPQCPQFKLLRMEGSVYFAAVDHVRDCLRRFRDEAPGQKHLLVMVKSMNIVDQAGVRLWRDELHKRRAIGGDLYFHRPRGPVLEAWARSGLTEQLGADHVFGTKNEAIRQIVARLDPAICARCDARIFAECPSREGQLDKDSDKA